jgi:conjugative transfer signal peptidase TraF
VRVSRWLEAGVLVAGGLALAWFAGLRFNHTPSAPYGLWRLTDGYRVRQRGVYVLVCPPDTTVFREALARGYLSRGYCPSGLSPLLKRVAGCGGDRIDITGEGVSVNGVLLANSKLLAADGRGQVLPRAAGGRLAPDAVWLYSKAYRSFDSRYFGPLPVSAIEGVAWPLLTWGGAP